MFISVLFPFRLQFVLLQMILKMCFLYWYSDIIIGLLVLFKTYRFFLHCTSKPSVGSG